MRVLEGGSDLHKTREPGGFEAFAEAASIAQKDAASLHLRRQTSSVMQKCCGGVHDWCGHTLDQELECFDFVSAAAEQRVGRLAWNA